MRLLIKYIINKLPLNAEEEAEVRTHAFIIISLITFLYNILLYVFVVNVACVMVSGVYNII